MKRSMTDKVKPCPFCGGAPQVSDRASNNTPTGHVWFIVCMCGGYSAHAHQDGDTQDEAIAAWNCRAAAPPTPAAVPLTDEQVDATICKICPLEVCTADHEWLYDFARAILAAAGDKA